MFRRFVFSTIVTACTALAAIGEETGKPYLGIIGENATTETPGGPLGAVVNDVAPGSPAEKGGLKEFDRIIKLNNDEVKTFEDLKGLVSKLRAKDKINLKVVRGKEELDLTIELGDAADRPDPGPRRQLRKMLEENRPDDGPIFEGPVPGQDVREMLKPRPMVGVQVQPIDDALRAHLNLGEVKGVVVADVVRAARPTRSASNRKTSSPRPTVTTSPTPPTCKRSSSRKRRETKSLFKLPVPAKYQRKSSTLRNDHRWGSDSLCECPTWAT